jgi:hypothetical protein
MTKIVNAFIGDYSFLSNFYPAPMTYRGVFYPTSEHAYQAAKTDDLNYKSIIATAPTPSGAKRLGKRAPIREDWNDVKLGVMLEVVLAKFDQNPNLLKKLTDLEGYELVEGNYWNDTYWGVCRGKGSNHLGKILMMVRDEALEKARSKE